MPNNFKVKEDLTGQTFGRLSVIGRAEDYVYPSGKRRPKWLCKCECGKIITVIAVNLKRGTTQSCGCLRKEILSERQKTHSGYANKEPLYQVWLNMKKRCNNPNDQHYKYYGGRGVSIIPEWSNNYSVFRDWALSHGYKKGLSLDRVNVDGNYEPDNCRWATMKTQQNNRRSCKYIEHNGEVHTIKEWSKILEIKYSTLYSRITKYNMPFEVAISLK